MTVALKCSCKRLDQPDVRLFYEKQQIRLNYYAPFTQFIDKLVFRPQHINKQRSTFDYVFIFPSPITVTKSIFMPNINNTQLLPFQFNYFTVSVTVQQFTVSLTVRQFTVSVSVRQFTVSVTVQQFTVNVTV